MTRSIAATGTTSGIPNRCPACGQPLIELVRGRCPLCDHTIVDEPVTNQDHSPFADSPHHGSKAWWAMCKWIWGAGTDRLAHLGLMQSSPASRRFARMTLFLLAATIALCCLALSGWRAVEVVPDAPDNAPQIPSGRGWSCVTALPEDAAKGDDGSGQIVAWWWNAPQASISASLAFVTALILAAVLMAILRVGVERSLRRKYRGQQRLTAALGYSTSWGLPLIPAGFILALLPICRVAPLADWPAQPPESFVYVPAAVLAVLAVFMWWFGLMRLASVVPVSSRKSVTLFCGLWMPIIAAGLIVGSIWGLLWCQEGISSALHLQW